MKRVTLIASIGFELTIAQSIIELNNDKVVHIICAKNVKSHFNEPELFKFINPGKDLEDTNFYELEPSKFMSMPKYNFKTR
jgi:5,10-methylene-tetrahydrofolate dehydrogenase/methenyl tetrahydrofolate cyclohydrolase